MSGDDSAFWEQFVGRDVVIDTISSYVFIGTLTNASGPFVELNSVDVHDHAESGSTKEKYVMDTKKFGVKRNRNAVCLPKDRIIAISKLEDVIEY
jgi:hypothetical protein